MAAQPMGQARALCVLIALVYAVGYLYAIGDISSRAAMDVELRLMPDALSMMWHRRFGVQFEGIAILALPGLLWLASPPNTAIAITLGFLVGWNGVLGWRAYRRRQCRIGGLTASASAFPALVSGAACCAPLTLLTLGIPMTASLMTLFQWLVPLAAVMLIASGLWLRRQAAMS